MSNGSRNRRYSAGAKLAAAAALFLGSAPLLAACGSSDSSDHVNCVDKTTNKVVDKSECDHATGSSPLFWYWLTSSSHPVGYSVPPGQRSSYVNPGDPAARAKVGLSKTGTVNDTVPHAGGFGGEGDGAHGGDSGGG